MKLPPIITKVLSDYYRFVIGGVVLVVLVFGYVLVLAPKVTDVRSKQLTDQRNAESDLKAQQEYRAQLQKSNDQFTTTLPADSLTRINQFIPSNADFPGLMLTIKNIVSQAGLNLKSITVGQIGQTVASAGTSAPIAANRNGTPGAQAATVSGIDLKMQDVTIVVGGGSSYETFKQLLQLFETSRRLFDIVSVNFSSGAATTDTGQAEASWTLVLRTYYLPS